MSLVAAASVALYAAAIVVYALAAYNMPARPNLLGLGGALLAVALLLSHWVR